MSVKIIRGEVVKPPVTKVVFELTPQQAVAIFNIIGRTTHSCLYPLYTEMVSRGFKEHPTMISFDRNLIMTDNNILNEEVNKL